VEAFMKSLPRYMQVMNYYIAMIKSGQLKEGDKMPTEEEICSMFDISRITVRRALDDLMQNGYIYKQQGKGSFVMVRKKGFQLDHLTSFTEEMKMIGKTPTSQILTFDIVTPGEKAADVLGIHQSQKIYLLERLRCADGIPLAIERVHLPFYRFPTLRQANLKESLYDILQFQFGVESYKGVQEIRAGLASEEEAKLLAITPGSAVLHISRATSEQDGTVYEYVESIYRGDLYQFNVTLYK
jgi:GntR family transcriptional regulator